MAATPSLPALPFERGSLFEPEPRPMRDSVTGGLEALPVTW